MPSREELIQAIQQEMANRQNPNRISTREQAQQVAEDTDRGGLEAGPWYMDVAKDVLNPIDMAAGLVTGGVKAAGQGLRSVGKAAVEGSLGRAAEQQGVIDLVNEGHGLAPHAKNLIDEAVQGISSNSIAPKDKALRELLQGRSGQVNPDVVSKVFPNYAKKLAERASLIEEPRLGSLGEEVISSTPGSVELSGERLLRLKRAADKAAGYSKSQAPFSEVAASKNADARQLADVARNQIYEQAPGSQDILADMGRDIKLKKFLQKRGESDPIGLLKAKPGTTKDSILSAADKSAGTNLRGYGDEIENAVELQMDPRRLANPLGVLPEVRKMATRGVIKAGDLGNSAANTVGEVVGKTPLPEALGYGGAIEAVDSTKSTQAPTPDQNRSDLIQRIQQEMQRRQSQ